MTEETKRILAKNKWIKSEIWGDVIYHLDQFNGLTNPYKHNISVAVSKWKGDGFSYTDYECNVSGGAYGETGETISLCSIDGVNIHKAKKAAINLAKECLDIEGDDFLRC